MCRARLYRMESRELSGDTPVPTPAWKESCKKAIIPEVLKMGELSSFISRLTSLHVTSAQVIERANHEHGCYLSDFKFASICENM